MNIKHLCLLLFALPALLLGTIAIGNGTVAGLPAGGLNTNSITIIVDGATTSDCTVGLGSQYVACRDNGAAWVKAFPGGQFVDFTPTAEPAYLEGRVFYDPDDDALAYYSFDSQVTLQIGQETWVKVKNTSGLEITDGQVVYINGAVGASGVPTVDLALADDIDTSHHIGIATMDIANNGIGFATITGIVRGINTDGLGEGSPLFLSATTPGAYTVTAPVSPNYEVQVGIVVNDHAANGSVFVFVDHVHLGMGVTSQYRRGDDTWQTLNGAAVINTPAGDIAAIEVQAAIDELDTEKAIQAVLAGLTNALSVQQVDPTIINTAGVLYVEVEAQGGGDVDFIFNNAVYTLDCTTGPGSGGKARIALTEGADSNNPVKNWVTAVVSGPNAVLANATSHPTGTYANIATATVPDDTTFDAEGAYQFQRATESLTLTSNGALHHQREKLREGHAQWVSGAAPTLSIVGGSPDTVHLNTSGGVVRQLHRQTWDATTSSKYYYGNGTAQWDDIADLSDALSTNAGASMSGKYFNLVLFGAMNKNGHTKVYVNLPTGFYNQPENASADPANTAVTSIPSELNSVGFLIARLVLRHQVSGGGTWTEVETIDLRNALPSAVGGGASSTTASQFSDANFEVFNNTDPTKAMTLDVSGVTAGQVSDLAVPDADGTIALQSAITATCAAGVASMTVTAGIVTALVCN